MKTLTVCRHTLGDAMSAQQCCLHVSPPIAMRSFLRGSPVLLRDHHHTTSYGRSRVPERPQSFKFLKDLGFKKPSFLPDFGKAKRQAVLNRFYTQLDRQTFEEVLSNDFEMTEAREGARTFHKQDWITLLCDYTLPAIPDFNWTAAVDATKDAEGYCIVTVQATGHHTGAPFRLLGLDSPPIPASGKRFRLAEERMKVKVEDDQIKQMVVLPSKGAGPRALYDALSDKTPAAASLDD